MQKKAFESKNERSKGRREWGKRVGGTWREKARGGGRDTENILICNSKISQEVRNRDNLLY